MDLFKIIILGIIIVAVLALTHSLYLGFSLRQRLKKELSFFSKFWALIYFFNFLFLVFYIGYFLVIYFSESFNFLRHFFLSLILFFEAIFSITNISIFTKTVSSYQEINKNLSKSKKEVESKSNDLEKAERKLIKQNKEMEETLEDFYTLRLSMEARLEEESLGKIKKENKEIKKKLEKVRRRK